MATFIKLADDLIEEGLGNGGVIASELAGKLLEVHGDEATEFLSAHAQAFLADWIRARIRSRVQEVRHRAKSGSFAAAIAEGAVPSLSPFSVGQEIDGVYRRLGVWTGEDHRKIAAGYHAESVNAAMYEAFHLAVAKKVGKRRTEDVFTEDQYLRMLGRFIKPMPNEEEAA